MTNPPSELKVACVQLTSGIDLEYNRQQVEVALQEAVENEAQWIVLPEAVNLLQQKNPLARATAVTEEEDPVLKYCQDIAGKAGVWIHIGSLILRNSTAEGRLLNRGFVIDDQGKIRARYDKIHLFDAILSDQESYRESASFEAGKEAVLLQTPWGGYGMSICYDMRFPHLYRTLSQAGAQILAIPAAFTRPTGKAHWHTLLRARAIENGCFVIAAAQCGEHQDGRATYGHSLIISPWGEILAEAGETPCNLYGTISLTEPERVRYKVPAWQHQPQFRLTFC